MSAGELIRRTIGALANPEPVAMLIAAAGLVLRLKWRRVSGIVLCCAAAVAYIGSLAIVGDALIGPLEREFRPLRATQPVPGVNYIVVLGSGYSPHDDLAVTAALDHDGLVRVVEGVRLARILGPVRLVLSGGAPAGRSAPAVGYAELARGLGIPDASMVILDGSMNTSDEAASLAKLLGAQRYILVTSAYHMPRAMRLMRRCGMDPIPAPAGQSVTQEHRAWYGLIPTSGGLASTERAVHEYLGLAALATGLE